MKHTTPSCEEFLARDEYVSYQRVNISWGLLWIWAEHSFDFSQQRPPVLHICCGRIKYPQVVIWAKNEDRTASPPQQLLGLVQIWNCHKFTVQPLSAQNRQRNGCVMDTLCARSTRLSASLTCILQLWVRTIDLCFFFFFFCLGTCVLAQTKLHHLCVPFCCAFCKLRRGLLCI